MWGVRIKMQRTGHGRFGVLCIFSYEQGGIPVHLGHLGFVASPNSNVDPFLFSLSVYTVILSPSLPGAFLILCLNSDVTFFTVLQLTAITH